MGTIIQFTAELDVYDFNALIMITTDSLLNLSSTCRYFIGHALGDSFFVQTFFFFFEFSQRGWESYGDCEGERKIIGHPHSGFFFFYIFYYNYQSFNYYFSDLLKPHQNVNYFNVGGACTSNHCVHKKATLVSWE